MTDPVCNDCGYLLDDDGQCHECIANLLDKIGRRDMVETTYDPVNKPAHYNIGDGIECIDYIKQVLGPEGFIAYCHGNTIKYQHRYRYKQNPLEDIQKAKWYLNKMEEALREKHK